MDVLKSLDERYFCVNKASQLSSKFDLPPPSANLLTIPTLLALNGQTDIAINLMSIVDSGLAFPEFQNYHQVTSHLNSFIIHMGEWPSLFIDVTELLGEHKERRLLQFLREYMLLAEIAYIEQIAPVSKIPSEVPKFRNNYSDYVNFAICVIGRDSRSWSDGDTRGCIG